jgi:hypothetical protein
VRFSNRFNKFVDDFRAKMVEPINPVPDMLVHVPASQLVFRYLVCDGVIDDDGPVIFTKFEKIRY